MVPTRSLRLLASTTTAFLAVATLVGGSLTEMEDEPERERDVLVSIDGVVCWEYKPTNDPDGEEPEHTTCGATLLLSEAAPGPIMIGVETSDGTAVAGEDYRPFEKVEVVVPKGARQLTIPLDIVADKTKEPEEYFFVGIVEVSTGKIRIPEAVVRIRDGAKPDCQEVH